VIRNDVGAMLSAMLLGVAACAESTGPVASPARFVGAPIEQAIARFGSGYVRTARADGTSEYAWRYEGVRLVRAPGGPPPTGGAGGSSRFGTPVEPARRDWLALAQEHCVLSFVTDARSIISEWRAEGEACIYALSEPGAFDSKAPE
jgi:hypothetical protein